MNVVLSNQVRLYLCETEQQQQPTSDSNLSATKGRAMAGGVASIVTMLIVSLVVRDIR